MLLATYVGIDRAKFAHVLKSLKRPEKFSTKEDVLAMAPTWLMTSPEVMKVLGIEQRPNYPFGIMHNGTWQGIEIYHDALFPRDGIVLGGTMMGPMDAIRRLRVCVD
jgi:hypothetical protein